MVFIFFIFFILTNREEFRKVGIDEVFAKPLDIQQLESFYSRVKYEKEKLRRGENFYKEGRE